MIRLWGRTNSLNVQKVLWTLAELDLAYERTEAGLAFGVVDTPAYRALNPNGLVPTIDDGGFVLWESNVIIRYLAAKYGGPLYPADLRPRFEAERWMDWQQTSLNPPIGTVFFNLIRQPPEKRNQAAVDTSIREVERFLPMLDSRLAGHPYLAGESFTMADIPAGTSVSRWYKLPIARQPHPNVEAWLARLKERPGFRTHIDLPLN